MINLLPPQQKKELLIEEKHKIFFIFEFLTVFFLITAFLAFFAVRVYISGKIQSEKMTAPPQIQDQEKEIMAINKELQNLRDFYKKRQSFTELLEKISKTIPDNIYLSSLSLSPAKEKDSFLASLQGFSQNRELLFQLKKNLESEPGLKDINFPSSNWVKPENIEFNVNFKLNYEKD